MGEIGEETAAGMVMDRPAVKRIRIVRADVHRVPWIVCVTKPAIAARFVYRLVRQMRIVQWVAMVSSCVMKTKGSACAVRLGSGEGGVDRCSGAGVSRFGINRERALKNPF